MPASFSTAQGAFALTLGLAAVALVAALAPRDGVLEGETASGSEPPAVPFAPGTEGTGGASSPSAHVDTQVFSGRVQQAFDVPNYTYLRLATETGDVWTAISTARIEPGAHVRVASQVEMRDFESKALSRTFDVIHFGQLVPDGALSDFRQPDAPLPPGHPPVDATDAVDVPHATAAAATSATKTTEAVPRATGTDARTVAEIHETRKALSGRRVSVRGRVVKITQGVLGKNYLHLRDGSGSPDTNDHDLTVTTQAAPQLGDVVTLRGVVQVDRDIGVGYSYPVLLDDAELLQ